MNQNFYGTEGISKIFVALKGESIIFVALKELAHVYLTLIPSPQFQLHRICKMPSQLSKDAALT